ncbi:MAG: hypothetical protein ACRC8A_07735 [Microcoleaceae cyanobacterium]
MSKFLNVEEAFGTVEPIVGADRREVSCGSQSLSAAAQLHRYLASAPQFSC